MAKSRRSKMETIGRVSKLDWSQIEPAAFGILFERGLDPGRRAQLGAHYTRRLVEAHGGTIRAERPPEGGTRVIFDLPGPPGRD
jgi:hypothetical protein